jgi:hypothetical protein
MRAKTARFATAANDAGKRLFNTWLDGAST